MGGFVKVSPVGIGGGFSTCFASSILLLHYQVRKMNENLCVINEYTIVSHEVQTYN